MMRFNKINLLKFALVAASCLIGLDFILQSDKDLNKEEVLVLKGRDSNNLVHIQTKYVKKDKPDRKFHDLNKQMDAYNNNNNNQQVNIDNRDNYIMELSSQRIDKLLDILFQKEKEYNSVMKSLGLVMFDNLINGQHDPALDEFRDEEKTFFKIKDNRVKVTDEFIAYLHNISDYYTFKHPRDSIKKFKVDSKQDKPVIVTAANTNYYQPLQATIYQLHRFMPDYDIIVYDLGLTDFMHKMTVDNCRCKVIKFDPSYSKVSDHISNLKSYAWKPIIIQETLKTHESLIYIDSSIRISSDAIGALIETLKSTSLLTQFIGLKLNCYTNPLMFEWFGESAAAYDEMFTIEANILLFRRTFLSTLLMKTWVTCALDKACIDPPGSTIGGCCGCHRFDQDAITIAASYFYGHPRDVRAKLPAYSLTTTESFFFSVRRYEGRAYFTEKAL